MTRRRFGVSQGDGVMLDLDERPRLPLIETIEPLNGSWANNNQWGASRSDPYPASPGQRVLVLDMPALPGPPAMHTITLDRFGIDRLLNSDIRAEIEYGSGGVRNTIRCDWCNGTQLSLVANAFRVSYVSYRPTLFLPYQTQAENLNVSATVGKGARPSNSFAPTYTDRIEQIPDTVLQVYPVPDFARTLTLYFRGVIDPAALANILVTLTCSGDNAASALQFDASYFVRNPTIVIPGTLAELGITNNSGADIYPKIVWGLGL
jgi:hypothetical protein